MSCRAISPEFDNLDFPSECRRRRAEVPPPPPIHGSPMASRRVVPRLPLPIRPETRRISRSQFALNPTEDLSNNWKSPLSLVASKYAFGSRVMSSNDSLNMEHNQHNHDSPDQRVYGSMLASPAVSRRDFGPPPPAYAMPSQAPQQGKMLVDPQTGQHYFVPTAPQPHVAYYPVFYNAPPQSSQPVYYPHHPPAGYMVSAPPMPSPTIQNQPYYFPPTYNQQGSMSNFSQSFGHPPSSSQGYRVEVPPSSSVSICGERESPTQYFQRHHESRLSTESTNSSNSRHYVQNYIDGAKTDDSMSPVPHKSQNHTVTPPTSSNHAMDHSARYSTTSSSTTSGFVSQTGEGPTEHTRPNNLRNAFQKPQLYGSPAWWGEESSPEGRKHDERTPTRASNSRQNSRSEEKLQSPTTSTHSEIKLSQKSDSPATPCTQETDSKPVMKSIRMDIDLSRPFSPEEKEKVNVKAAAAVQSTAFTVNFDDSNEKPKRPKPPVLSSQEQQKRQFRRSVPPSKPSLPAAAGNDTKHYLFSKMIQGFPKGEDSNTSAMMALSIKSETDTLSEAGTYVIENKDNKANRRQRKYSTSSSSSSDSTETDGSSRPTYSQPSSARMYTPRTETATSSPVSSARSDHQKPSQPFPMKRHLMKDLRDLRTQNQQTQQPQAARPSLPAPKVRSMVDQSKNSRLNPPSPAKISQPQQTTSRAGISSSSAGFRSARCHSETRTDGGRFSMRSGVQQPTVGGMRPATSQTMHQKPPFKAGVAPAKKTSKDSPEMVAWLRRKEYDPRKSAAEAKKMQQLKQRSDNFFSNRSLSCNQPTAGGFRRLVRPFGDERSNKSHDDLSHVGEEPDDFSLSGSNSNLVRTVDELTQKCQRSMQLLKLCNPKALTPSVEHLLDEMVEEQGSVDGISAVDRLNRLSEAFGAIQKCLELQQNEKSGSVSPGSSSRDTVFTEALRQRLTSPTRMTDMDQSSSNSEVQSPDSFRPIAFRSN